MTRASSVHGETADEAFGRAVKMEMFRRRVTNRRLARELGVHETAVGKKLHGERPWTLAEMVQVADWLGVDLRDLLGTMWLTPGAPSLPAEVESTRRKVDGKRPEGSNVIPFPPREHLLAAQQAHVIAI